mmetsp:Transcript_41212/g.97729  ORF Transcript_41212/g.97729 Transcript_41212/m.97729 type:complete len:206 (+) Transcript_41212:35-652(+)
MARFAQGLLILVAGLCALCSGESTGAGLRVAGARWGVVSVQVASDSVALRLRGGTGQGGPSRGFRSKGSSMKWRHPHSLFCRAQNQKPEPKPQEKLENHRTRNHKSCMGKPCAPQRKHPKKLGLFIEGQKFHTYAQIRNLKRAQEDEWFNMGSDPNYEIPLEGDDVDYDYKALIKRPRAFKVGLRGYGKPAYDFTNRYIGGPKQG